MGDINRNWKFADFIFQHFPSKKYKTVLVLADGKGELSAILSKKYHVVTYEPKPRQAIKRKKVKYIPKHFNSYIPVEQDFIVAMHPDEATGELIEASYKYHKPFAVVPCCIKGKFSHGIQGYHNWLNKLKKESRTKVNETMLPIGGKNIILFRN